MLRRLWPDLRTRRLLFGLFAAIVLVATAWPGASLSGVTAVPRPDLYIHLFIWIAWGAGLFASELFGEMGSRRNLSFAMATAVVIGVGHELLHTLPMLRRTFGLDDLAMNAIGAIIGVAGMWLAARLLPGIFRQQQAGAREMVQ